MPTSWSDWWSDWVADQSQNLLCRVRQDHRENVDYEYNHDYEIRAETPRGDSQTIEALTAQVDGLSPGSNFDSQEYELNSGPRERTGSSKLKDDDREGGRRNERERERERDGEKKRSRHKTKDRNKGKWKFNHHDKKSSQRKSHGGHSVTPQSSDKVQAPICSAAVRSQLHYACEAHQYYTESGYLEHEAAYSTTSTAYDPEQMMQMSQAVTESDQMHHETHPNDAERNSSTTYSTLEYEFEPEGEEFTTPEGGTISADEDQFEEIDPMYWSEPQGSGEYKHASVSGRQQIQNRFGIKFFVGFRRFIVVANDQGHCTCVPILTYGGKGCNKNGVKPAKHGIIHEHGHKPRMLNGEPKLGFPAVQARITEVGERLSKESRVNYSKLVTVEHNVKVFFIGSVAPECWSQVADAVNDCWYQKVHQRRRN
ncbi:hypothetical protein E4U43_008123 [Claviceps pusilla]|uniref:DUF6590 domain-containing protein n=1 Tax=Claviceps pusilla TaxID=123648 RepID=A0A9P7SZY8_9HYPO|nr:hypothetical protein E4U43_008123 [Claviceps pusilla]